MNFSYTHDNIHYDHITKRFVNEKNNSNGKINKRYTSKFKNGKIYLMCCNCYMVNQYNIYQTQNMYIDDPNNEIDIYFSDPQYTIKRCKYCKTENPETAVLDENIAFIISKLNRLGYKTKYCCEGHNNYIDDYNYESGYIYFEDKSILDYLHLLPITWYLDIELLKYNNIVSIYFDYRDFDEAIRDMVNFVWQLPNINK